VLSATGTREVPQRRRDVWQALAVLEPYCAVCDVSYVVSGTGVGTTFVCVPGRLDGREPGPDAPRGEIVEWQSRRVVATRLDLPAERWTTRIELADIPAGGTRVTMTLGFESRAGGRLVARLQSRTQQRVVQQTLDAELDKVPQHVAQVTGSA
jgi:hypothetical protein